MTAVSGLGRLDYVDKGNNMSKAQKVDDLIDLGFTYEQIVEKESDISSSFIKGRFTKKGLDWKAEEQVVEEVLEELPEKREEASEEASEAEPQAGELPAQDGQSDSGAVSFDFDDAFPKKQRSEDEREAYDIAMAYLEDLGNVPVVRRARTGKYIQNVLAALEKGEFHPTELKGINCRFALIAPRPTPTNLYKELHKVQTIMQRLFKKNIRK